jgi:hypothetical protein
MVRPDFRALLAKLKFWKLGSSLEGPERIVVHICLTLIVLCGCGVLWGLFHMTHSFMARHRQAQSLAVAAGSRAVESDDEANADAAEGDEDSGDKEPSEEELSSSADSEENEAESGEKSADDEIHLGSSPLPKSVLARQDGKMESDHDLVDPEIEKTRNVASTLASSDLKVSSKLYRFVEIQEIFAGTRSGRQHEGHFMGDVVLELDSAEAEKEVRSRKTELQSVITSIVAERQQDRLKTREGHDEIKSDVQRELNHILHDGKVVDVLFTNYLVK